MLHDSIKKYRDCIIDIESTKEPSIEQILHVLNARDLVHIFLSANDCNKITTELSVLKLDERLRKKSAHITKNNHLKKLQRSLNPSKNSWWWYLDKEEQSIAWLFDFLSLILLIINTGFLIDLIFRIIGGLPSIAGTPILFIYSTITLLVGDSLLAKDGKANIERFLSSFDCPRNLISFIKLSLTFTLSIIMIGFRFTIPIISSNYQNSGYNAYLSKNYLLAKKKFERAIKIYPENGKAHFNLGKVYEKRLLDLEKARHEYKLALDHNIIEAYNALGHIHILEENYMQAKIILLEGLRANQKRYSRDSSKNSDRFFELRYNILVNLGWLTLKEKQYSQSQAYLYDAIDSSIEVSNSKDSDRVHAYCLLGQSLNIAATDKVNKNKSSSYLKDCIRYGDPLDSDQLTWIDTSKKILNLAQ